MLISIYSSISLDFWEGKKRERNTSNDLPVSYVFSTHM